MTRAVLAFDAGPGIGMGHQRRMEALAASLGELGTASELVPSVEGAEGDVLIVDSYRHRADDRERFDGGRVVAIDDLQRDLAVDLVVDPSPGASTDRHRAARRVLAGAAYALIDPSLSRLPTRAVDRDVELVLVTAGATDSDGAGAGLAAQLAELIPAARVQLVVGPWGSADVPNNVEPVKTTEGLGPVLAGADLVVTAGGVTMIESLALARPTVVVVLADNQRPGATGASTAGAVLLVDVDQAPAAAAELAASPERRSSLSRAAHALVDGQGARRVAESIVDLA